MKVLIYSRANCIQSKKLVKYLQKRKIHFINKDIDNSEDDLIEYERYGYTSTPLCVITDDDGTEFIEVGFNEGVKTILDMIL